MVSGMTKGQADAMAKGMLATMARESERKTVTLTIDYRDITLATLMHKVGILAGVKDVRNSEPPQVASLSQEVAMLRQRLADAQLRITQLNEYIDDHAHEVKRPKREMTLTQWANSMGFSYATAYRKMQSDQVQAKPMGSGRKNTGWMVFPDTYVPKVRTRKKKK